MNRCWRKADFLEQGREGVALGDNNFLVSRAFSSGSDFFCRLGRRGFGLGFSGVVRLVVAVFDLGERRLCREFCGLRLILSVLFLLELLDRRFQFEAAVGFFLASTSLDGKTRRARLNRAAMPLAASRWLFG